MTGDLGFLPTPSTPTELSLDLNLFSAHRPVRDLFRRNFTIGHGFDRVEDCIAMMEDELRKIRVFKRELPLCVRLLDDAIAMLKEEKMKSRESTTPSAFSEFIPLKKDCEKHQEHQEHNHNKDDNQKENWMSSAQIWKHNSSTTNTKKTHNKEEQSPPLTSSFSKFKDSRVSMGMKSQREGSVCTPPSDCLSLSSSPNLLCGKTNCGRRGEVSSSSSNLQQHHSSRKQRRCWSPELHRLFIHALHQLGGPQVATPKQIRQVMKIKGLTNDEVKSHLQKYRIHSRRVGAGGGSNRPIVVKGVWQCCDWEGGGGGSPSCSPQGPLQIPDIPDDPDDRSVSWAGR